MHLYQFCVITSSHSTFDKPGFDSRVGERDGEQNNWLYDVIEILEYLFAPSFLPIKSFTRKIAF